MNEFFDNLKEFAICNYFYYLIFMSNNCKNDFVNGIYNYFISVQF